MEVTKMSVPKNSEDGGKHPNHVNENVAVRTKNGLVNGVAGTKCKNNKKQKATNSVKKGQPNSKVQEAVDKMGESNRIEVPDEAKEKLVDCCTSINSNESALNQSKTKLNDQSKSKKNKKLKNGQQDNSSTLPKLDINAGVNLDHFMTNMKMISELPSTSHLDVNKSPLLQCGSSEFEKNLIESIKSLKIQNENSECKAQSEGAPEANTQSNESTQLQDEELQHCDNIKYVQYESELQMPMIMKIIQKDLSEPYSIYTYRYFIHNWPKLCFLAMCDEKCVGAIVCKLDYHRKSIKRGYIAMLAVDKDYRKRKIGSTLVSRAISQMVEGDADEVVLETEVTNKPALRLYEQLGFVRDKRLFRYYLNGVDALRLKLWLR